MQTIEQKMVINKIKSLPTLPQVFYRIIELIDSPDSSASDLERVVHQDPSIAAKVLKVVNSPLFTFGKQCVDLHQAIVRLGFETLKSVVLSVSIFRLTPGRSSMSVFSREDFWRHSIGAGEAARLAAKTIRYANADGAYLIGLIHDIGKVVLDFFFALEYERVGQRIIQNKHTIIQAEQDVMGIDHSIVGGWLADEWKFPQQLKAGILYHHSPSRAPHQFRVQAALAAIGNYVARKAHFGSGGDTIDPAFPGDIANMTEFSSLDFDIILGQFDEKRELIEETCRLIA